MKRSIYEVYAKIVDANGAYNTLSGYPKVFDSRSYNNDISKAMSRAYAEYYSCLGGMYLREDRQKQIAMIIDVDTGMQLEHTSIGEIADITPDPEPELEPEG